MKINFETINNLAALFFLNLFCLMLEYLDVKHYLFIQKAIFIFFCSYLEIFFALERYIKYSFALNDKNWN